MKRLMILMLALVVVSDVRAERTAITATVAPGLFTTAGTELTETTADVTNTNRVTMTGAGLDLLVARNTDASSHNVTVTSVADSRGRTGTITAESIPAGKTHIYGPFSLEGWRQSSDYSLYFDANSNTVKFSVIRLGK